MTYEAVILKYIPIIPMAIIAHTALWKTRQKLPACSQKAFSSIPDGSRGFLGVNNFKDCSQTAHESPKHPQNSLF